jgi:hypothetical protein
MMTKMYVLLSQIKGWDNCLIEEKMSTPLVSYILSGVILLVVLIRVISWLQYLHLKRKALKRFSEHKKNRVWRAELPVVIIEIPNLPENKNK